MPDSKSLDKRLDIIAGIIVKGFASVEESLEDKASKEDIRQILGALDAFTKRLEISEQERIVMGLQLDRLDGWVHELAKKLKYTLSA